MDSNDDHASIDSTHGSLTDLQQSFNQQQVMSNFANADERIIIV